MKTILFLAAGILLSASAFAAEGNWTCASGKVTRTIEVTYKGADKTPPCDVMYTKEGAEAKSVWSAANDQSYCMTQAQGLAEKLGRLGWECK